jgi:NhaP-type Na+/H+ and K+/H+ antiporter
MVVGHHTIYTSQVDVRSDSPAHRSRLLALPRRAAVLIEQAVPASSKLDGQLLEDIQLPGGCLIVAIVRDDNVLIPRGNTRLLAGDILTLAVQRPFEERIREILQGWLQGSDATIPPPTEQSAAIVEEDHAI